MNEVIYFTIAAILLYVAADKILVMIERLRGGHFKNRSLIFFALIMALSVGTFEVLQRVLPPKAPTTDTEQAAQSEGTEAPELPEAENETPRVSTPPTVE
jgi:hypothetical protein